MLYDYDGANWLEITGDHYRCPVRLIPEAGGGFSVIATTLPGVASQGETEAEALVNIKEALAGVIATYKAAGVPIPWTPGETERGGRVVFVCA